MSSTEKCGCHDSIALRKEVRELRMVVNRALALTYCFCKAGKLDFKHMRLMENVLTSKPENEAQEAPVCGSGDSGKVSDLKIGEFK